MLRAAETALAEVYGYVVETVGGNDHKLLVASICARAGRVVGMPQLNSEPQLPQLTAFEKTAGPGLHKHARSVSTLEK
jgi:hypothetical protein